MPGISPQKRGDACDAAANSRPRVQPYIRLLLCAASSLCGFLAARAQQHPAAISFDRDIYPILRDNCLACHGTSLKSGGLQMETYEDLMKGGRSGRVIVPGKSEESRLVLMLEGRIEPKMPQGGELKAAEIAAIKSWIDTGAGPPEGGTAEVSAATAVIPDIKPQVPLLPQVSSLAFRPDGAALAVAGYKEVKVFDAVQGERKTTLPGPGDLVRALAYSPDGKYLAAAGGPPARFGEVIIWNAATGAAVHILKGHNDYIYSVAFSPDSKLMATSSYDKLIKLWDVANGAELRTLKDHTDSVYPVAFSPDGKWLASGAADRTVKLWDVASGRRVFTLSDALDSIYALAFHPSGTKLSAAGADKVIRTWELSAEGGTLLRSIIAHEDAIIQLAYSPDGKILVSTGADRLIKVWDSEKGLAIKVLDRQPDWPLALAFSPDGERLAVGRYDGSVAIYEVATGRRILEPIRAPEATRADKLPKNRKAN